MRTQIATVLLVILSTSAACKDLKPERIYATLINDTARVAGVVPPNERQKKCQANENKCEVDVYFLGPNEAGTECKLSSSNLGPLVLSGYQLQKRIKWVVHGNFSVKFTANGIQVLNDSEGELASGDLDPQNLKFELIRKKYGKPGVHPNIRHSVLKYYINLSYTHPSLGEQFCYYDPVIWNLG